MAGRRYSRHRHRRRDRHRRGRLRQRSTAQPRDVRITGDVCIVRRVVAATASHLDRCPSSLTIIGACCRPHRSHREKTRSSRGPAAACWSGVDAVELPKRRDALRRRRELRPNHQTVDDIAARADQCPRRHGLGVDRHFAGHLRRCGVRHLLQRRRDVHAGDKFVAQAARKPLERANETGAALDGEAGDRPRWRSSGHVLQGPGLRRWRCRVSAFGQPLEPFTCNADDRRARRPPSAQLYAVSGDVYVWQAWQIDRRQLASETDISAGYDVVIYHPQTHSWTADPCILDWRAERAAAESTSYWSAAADIYSLPSQPWDSDGSTAPMMLAAHRARNSISPPTSGLSRRLGPSTILTRSPSGLVRRSSTTPRRSVER